MATLAAVDPRRPPRIDWWLLLSAAVLLAFGLMALYSEGMARDQGTNFRKQLMFAGIGIVPFAVWALARPKTWISLATPLYVVNVLALLAVRFIGSERKGAERWIDVGPLQFQPSEMAKLVTIVTLSAFFAARQDSIRSFSTFALSFLHLALPLALILLQPHLGAAMVLLVVWLAISLIAGVRLRYLGAVVVLLAGLAVLVVSVPSVSNLVLRDYQKGRVQGMFTRDQQGKNWQTDRAEIAFGVGGVTGTGFLRGPQKEGRFIPEQHNDFIFSVVGEEGGLVGSTLVLAAFGLFFWRVWLILLRASDPSNRMMVAGVFAALFFHTFVNIAMVLKLVPVVGLWLPFFSYGGTALWLCLSCVGLLMAIRRDERPVLFR